jgi:thiosulfate dehydrogenase [quinone] large subunit
MTADTSNQPQQTLALVYAALLMRLWLAVRAIQTGIEKFAGTKAATDVVSIDGQPNEYGLTAGGSVKFYSSENYHGVPEALMGKFKAEPLMLKWALPVYDMILGPLLLALGINILIGLASRTSLFLLGLLYISLTWGLILIKQDEGVSWLGVHMILIGMALALSQYNRFTVLKKW